MWMAVITKTTQNMTDDPLSSVVSVLGLNPDLNYAGGFEHLHRAAKDAVKKYEADPNNKSNEVKSVDFDIAMMPVTFV